MARRQGKARIRARKAAGAGPTATATDKAGGENKPWEWGEEE